MNEGARKRLADYRREVLRWNAQINLVSRRGTAARIDALMTQCDDALVALLNAPEPLGAVVAGRRVLYLDLGSGAGLPGVFWRERLVALAGELATWLVEPREKRAWFLERCARLEGEPSFGVLCGLWGEVEDVPHFNSETVVISLKALHLSDSEVLAGLPLFLDPPTKDVVIARFYPPEQVWSAEIAGSLEIPDAGTRSAVGAHKAEAVGAGVVRGDGGGASLVVSRYTLTP